MIKTLGLLDEIANVSRIDVEKLAHSERMQGPSPKSRQENLAQKVYGLGRWRSIYMPLYEDDLLADLKETITEEMKAAQSWLWRYENADPSWDGTDL